MQSKTFCTTFILLLTSLLSFTSALPAAEAEAAAAATSTSSSAAPTKTPPTFALGTLYSRGGYSTAYIIWSPTVNTTASQCNSPAAIDYTSAYTGPQHALCNYPFDFDGYKNLTLQCNGTQTVYESGSVTGILKKNGQKEWSCTYTPFSDVPPYSCPEAGVDPGYWPQVSLYYICQ